MAHMFTKRRASGARERSTCEHCILVQGNSSNSENDDDEACFGKNYVVMLGTARTSDKPRGLGGWGLWPRSISPH